MKTLQQAFFVGAAIFAGSTVFAGSVGPGNPQGGQAIALSNLNAAIVSGTTGGFYAGGSSTTPGLVGGVASGGFAGGSFAGGGFAPSAPSGPSSLLLPPSGPTFLGTGGGTTTNSNSNPSNSTPSNSNSSNSNSNSNSSGSNSTNNSSGNTPSANSNSSNNTTGGGSSGSSTGGTTFFSALAVTGPQDVASVPDNGTAIAFLGAALAGLALLRRTFRV